MSFWTIFWWVLAAGGAYVALIVARAVQMHFELKRELKVAGVQFAEKKSKDAPRS
jgi:hypothetical protein